MGLDVYCVWPGMTEEERKRKVTGSQNTGKVGYLYHNWSSLGAWQQIFAFVFDKCWSSFLYPDWDGGNDGLGPDMSDPDECKIITENREILVAWLAKPESQFDAQPLLDSGTFEPGTTPESCYRSLRFEVQDLVDFMDLALAKPDASIMFW